MRQIRVGNVVHAVSRIALIGALGSLAAGCSGEVRRFAENPFQNPFKTFSDDPEPGMTGSIAQRTPSAPRRNVSSAPLAAAPRAAAAPAYNQPAGPKPAAVAGRGGWSSEGGTLLTVRRGDTLGTISERYGVPPTAILSTNNISAAQVAPGQRIVIPVYSATTRSVAAAPAAVAPSTGSVQGMNPTEGRVVSTTRIAPAPKVAAPKAAPAPRLAAAVAEAPKTRVRPGMTPAPAARIAVAAPVKVEPRRAALVEPKTTGSVEPRKAAEKPAARAPEPKVAAAKVEPVKAQQKSAKAPEAPKLTPVKVAAAEPAKPVREPETTASAVPAPAAAPAPASAEFRWPARGRVIAGFGGSGSNEGVNIAVPEGTPVKAAEGGTVAYAGSEVKGYGNLVLIRHDNGYVSAYAHNGDVEVKRGQKVTRGQTIAKSGQTGNVTSPQLHFEIRKGSTPVDPMKYLASN